MATQEGAFPGGQSGATIETAAFAPLCARRLLVIGGIALIFVGMIFGDILAVFVLHQNAARINESLLAATRAVVARNLAAIPAEFQAIGGFLENRGTKVDAHGHMIAFGYLALLLALVQPYVALREFWKKRLAWVFVAAAVLLPVGVFLIHYVGLAYSPFAAIGWASVAADFGGFLLIGALAGEMTGFLRYLRGEAKNKALDKLLQEHTRTGQTLLAWGTLLVLAGFLHGSYYAGTQLYQNEARDTALLTAITSEAAANHQAAAEQAAGNFAELQGEVAVNIAAHAHVIEFGILAMLLAFFQPYVFLSERWKRIWAAVLLLGSAALPVFVLLELRMGLVAGGIADLAGLMVVFALFGMLIGVVRYTGRLDAESGAGQ